MKEGVKSGNLCFRDHHAVVTLAKHYEGYSTFLGKKAVHSKIKEI